MDKQVGEGNDIPVKTTKNKAGPSASLAGMKPPSEAPQPPSSQEAKAPQKKSKKGKQKSIVGRPPSMPPPPPMPPPNDSPKPVPAPGLSEPTAAADTIRIAKEPESTGKESADTTDASRDVSDGTGSKADAATAKEEDTGLDDFLKRIDDTLGSLDTTPSANEEKLGHLQARSAPNLAQSGELSSTGNVPDCVPKGLGTHGEKPQSDAATSGAAHRTVQAGKLKKSAPGTKSTVTASPAAQSSAGAAQVPTMVQLWAARRSAFIKFKTIFSTVGFDVQKWSDRGSNSTPSPRTLYATDDECSQITWKETDTSGGSMFKVSFNKKKTSLPIEDLGDVKFSRTERKTYFLRLEFPSRNLDLEVQASQFSEIAGGLFELMLNHKCEKMTIDLLRDKLAQSPQVREMLPIPGSKGEKSALEGLLVNLLMSNVHEHFKSLLNNGS